MTGHFIRLVHTSDWHIGHELFGHERRAEHDSFLHWLVDRLEDEKADALLITGDIYDVANPPVSAMERFYRFLRNATARCPALQIVVIGGNHDSAARINLPAALLGEGRIHLVGALPRCDGGPDMERLLIPLKGRDGALAAWVAAVPYCRPGDLGVGGLAGLYEQIMEEGSRRAGDLPLVVTGHLHVAGGDMSEQSERRITVGGEEAEAACLFDSRATYAALGHLHRPQRIQGDTIIRYAGSPFPLSATERNYRHSITVLDLEGKTAVWREEMIPRTVPFLVLPENGPRPLDEVEALLSSLTLDETLPRDLQPFLEVSVLVDGPEPNLQARILAAVEGKPVRLTRVLRVAARAVEGGGIAARAEELTELRPEDIFAEIHQGKHGGAPPEDLRRAFLELLLDVQQGEA